MKTNEILVNNKGMGIDAALQDTEMVAAQMGLTKREALHLRLLAEETLGMVGAMVDEFHAAFWLESEGLRCRINLEALALMDGDKKRELMSTSSSGKNILAKGLMGRIAETIENGLYHYDDVMRIQNEYGAMRGPDAPSYYDDFPYYWSLNEFRRECEEQQEQEDPSYLEEDLERSIVANLADDIKVGVRDQRVKLIITKEFA